jgi:hypothetical protein
MKLASIESFNPVKIKHENTQEIFERYLELQDQFIGQLERCQQKGINLQLSKVSFPLLSFVNITFSECYVVAEVHQRRHLWQAKQTLMKIRTVKRSII